MATDSCILAWKNSMDKGASWATVYGVKKSWTWLSTPHHAHTHKTWVNCIVVVQSVMSNSFWPHGLHTHTHTPRVNCIIVVQSCPTLFDPMDCSMPDFPVLHNLPKLAQTHVSWVSEAIHCPSSEAVLCPPLLLSSVFPSIREFSNESALHLRWPKYWSFSFSISPSNDYSELISFRIGWIDLQQHSSKASTLRRSAFLWSNSHIRTWLLEKP